MNISTAIVLIVIFAAFALAIGHTIKNKSACSCGYDCGKCGKCACSNRENI